MRSERVQAFSDGVMAVIITIMVLELSAPEGDSWRVITQARANEASEAG